MVESCRKDRDCQEYPFFACSENKYCVHKGIFPIYGKEFIGILVLTCLIALANVSGVGGGGLIIPISMAFFNFQVNHAIAIAGFSIFMGSVARFLHSYDKRHPTKDATLIDYGIVIVMMPLYLLGSYIGVLVNLMLPPILLSLSLMVVLQLLTFQLYSKGKKKYAEETQELQQALELESEAKTNANFIPASGTTSEQYQPFQDEDEAREIGCSGYEVRVTQVATGRERLVSDPDALTTRFSTKSVEPEMLEEQQVGNGKFEDPSPIGNQLNESERSASQRNLPTQEQLLEVASLLTAQKSHVSQWRKHLLAFTGVTISFLISIMRGTFFKTPSIIGIQKCGELDGTIFTAFVILSLILTYVGVRINLREQAIKEKCGVSCAKELSYRGASLWYLLSFAFIGGWVSGAFGLGGGSVPLMIELGVPPLVATATGMYMIMLSTAASSFIFVSFGTLNVEFALWLGSWSIVGILIGLTAVDTLIQKFKRQSILIFLLVFVMGISAILVPVFNGLAIWQRIEKGEDVWKFTSICQ